MDPDALLDVAVAIDRDIRRQRMAEQEEDRPENPLAGWSLRDQRLYWQHQRRQDRRNGIDHAADAEHRLIQHLNVVYGESPEGEALNRKSPYDYVKLNFPDYVNP
jgi:hypothetical protein